MPLCGIQTERTMTRLDNSSMPTHAPAVTVIMANYNGAAYLADAIASVQRQSLRNLELIVSDDGSNDDSIRIVNEAIGADPRIRLIEGEQNGGPGAARNKALAIAKGDWVAIMDSDDLMQPSRLATLVEAAERDGADIVADNLVEFEKEVSRPSGYLLTGIWGQAPFWVDIKEYVQLNELYHSGPALGYLKPMFRSSLFAEPGLHYDETLRIGEDFDLVLRMMHRGKRFRVYPLKLYYYRKHGASASHRLSERALLAMKAANLRFLDQLADSDRPLASAIRARARSIETALAYEELLCALKGGSLLKAFGIAATRPQAIALLRLPIGVRLRRGLGGRLKIQV
jgi:glycosyltransferase involved in cell wall biosynthesis